MNTKPSVSFLTADSDAQLIVDTQTILADMAGNPNYPVSSPGLPVIQTALDEFSTALANAAGGGVTLTAIKNDKRAALVALLRQLSSYLQVACKGDLTILLSSGFPVQKPQRTPIGVLPAPSNVSLVGGSLSGELDASAQPITGAAIYNWRLALATTPTVYLQTAQTTAASNTFDGLTPGVTYVVQANAVGSAGPSDWSNPVPQMAV